MLRAASGEQRLEMRDQGPYPTRTGARVTAHHFTAELPTGLGDLRYYIEAIDERGNSSLSSLERIFLA